MTSYTPPKVLVTGGTGFVATELIQQLLAKGYRVSASVRDVTNESKNSFLVSLGKLYPGQLDLFSADLSDASAWDGHVEDVRYVFHTASPVRMTSERPQEEIVAPAIAGVENLLRAVGKSSSPPERVVLTSTLGAIRGMEDLMKMDGSTIYTSDDWNEKSKIETEPYPLSKTLAERRAWELAKELGIDLVAVHPSWVIGPSSSPNVAAGVAYLGIMLRGEMPVGGFNHVDIREVGRAHIAAAENPRAKGRYILSLEAVGDFGPVLAKLRDEFPQYDFPEPTEPKSHPRSLDASPAVRDLGFSLETPLSVSVVDAVRTLLPRGLITLKEKAAAQA